MEKIGFYTSKKKLLPIMFACIIFASASLYLFNHPEEMERFRGISLEMVKWFNGSFLLFNLIAIIIISWKLFFSKNPAVTLSIDGLYSFETGFLPWKAIKSVKVTECSFTKKMRLSRSDFEKVTLTLYSPEDYFKGLNLIYIQSQNNQIALNSDIDIRANELALKIEDFLKGCK